MERKIIFLIIFIFFLIVFGIWENSFDNEESILLKNVSITRYKGIWMPFLEQTENALNDIENLKKDGINIVAIGIKICKSDKEFYVCENESKIKNAVSKFHKNNIATLLILNPAHPDFDMDFEPSILESRKVLEILTPLVLEWAEVSEEYGVWMFCPLYEPQLVENKEEISKWAQEMLPEIRKRYNGKICFNDHGNESGVYGYNLSEYDFIVINQFTCTKDIDEFPEIVEKINKRGLDFIKRAYPGQKFIYFGIGAFTGPDSQEWEPISPLNMPKTHPDLDPDFFTVSNELQAACYENFFKLTWNATEGYFLTIDKGFEYRNKPAEKIIRKWFNDVYSDSG